MRRSLQVLLVGLVLTGCAGRTPPPRHFPTAPPAAVVRLQMDAGRCAIVMPAPVTVRGGGRISWRVDNECPDPHRVTIGDFKVKALGEREWPFDTAATDASCEAAPNRQCWVRLNVLSREDMKNLRRAERHGAWVYAYAIQLDARAEDPEIIIDWP